MTPITFLIYNSWFFVCLAIASIICFSIRGTIILCGDSNLRKFEKLKRPTLYYDYTKPFKYIWYFGFYIFYFVGAVLSLSPITITLSVLAVISMLAK